MNFFTKINDIPYKLKKFFHESFLILKLGLPLVVTQLLMTMIEFIDSIMAGNISSVDLAALAIALAIYHPVFLLVLGILIPLSSIIAQFFGARNLKEIVNNAIQGFWLSQIFAFLSIMFLSNVDNFLYKFGYEEEVIRITTDYLKALCWGIPSLYAFLVLRLFAEGLSITRPTMYFSIIGLVLKVFLNYILMFGLYGFPHLGTVGAGWATTITQWIMLIMILIFIARSHLFIKYRKLFVFRKPESSYLKEILRVGMPHGLGIAAETGLFTAVSLIIGTFGVNAVAGHQIAINVASLTFMIPMGISIAISIRVGLAIGKYNFKDAEYIGRIGIFICVSIMAISSLVFIMIPEIIVKFYTDDTNLNQQAVKLIYMAAIFQISDGMQVGALGALRGLKDTRIPFITNVFSYWLIGLPSAYIFGIHYKFGPIGMWMGLIIGLSIAALLHTWRFKILSKRLSSQLK